MCTLKAVGAAPLSLAPSLVVGCVMVVAASAAPSAANRPLLFICSALLSWLAAALTVQLLACGYWRMYSGQALPPSSGIRSLRSLAWPLLTAAIWGSLLVILGVAVFVVGAALGAAVALWVLFAASIDGLSGRAAVDRAWVLSGMSGALWTCLCLLLAGFVAWAASLGLSQVVGPAAVAAIPALITLLAVPPVFSAFLSRRS